MIVSEYSGFTNKWGLRVALENISEGWACGNGRYAEDYPGIPTTHNRRMRNLEQTLDAIQSVTRELAK